MEQKTQFFFEIINRELSQFDCFDKVFSGSTKYSEIEKLLKKKTYYKFWRTMLLVQTRRA